jgi:hypothetical protein
MQFIELIGQSLLRLNLVTDLMSELKMKSHRVILNIQFTDPVSNMSGSTQTGHNFVTKG